MLVDSHCHLTYPDFKEDLPEVLARADASGIKTMLSICCKLNEADELFELVEKHSNIYCSIGVHPHYAAEHEGAKAEDIIKLCQHEKVIGIGETGLDYYYENSPKQIQQDLFIEHIKAARETGLPIIIHTRSADEDTVKILNEEQNKGAFKGLIHCFSTGKSVSDCAIENDMSVSISGIITFKKSEELREITKDIPLENLLIETDSPYLAPVPNRGKRNEPAFTKDTAVKLAALKNIGFEELAAATTENFFNLFSKAKRV